MQLKLPFVLPEEFYILIQSISAILLYVSSQHEEYEILFGKVLTQKMSGLGS